MEMIVALYPTHMCPTHMIELTYITVPWYHDRVLWKTEESTSTITVVPLSLDTWVLVRLSTNWCVHGHEHVSGVPVLTMSMMVSFWWILPCTRGMNENTKQNSCSSPDEETMRMIQPGLASSYYIIRCGKMTQQTFSGDMHRMWTHTQCNH